MKEYPNQVPTQRVRNIPANPPRRRAVADTPPRPVADSVRRADTDTVPRADAVPDTPRRADDTDTLRRTRRVRRRARTLPRPLHTIMTASAGLVVALFLMPFLLTSDGRTSAVTVSEMLNGAEVVRTGVEIPRDPEAEIIAEPEAQPEAVPEPVPEAQPEPFTGQLDEDCMLKVLDKKSGEVSVMSMQEYLVCVLRGEMPGYFQLEALKAQAVAARTYTRYMLHSGSKHGDKADICTSPACCQAYLSAAAAKKKWGYLPELAGDEAVGAGIIARAIDEKSPYSGAHCQRVPVIARMIAMAAVMDTDGEIMLYDGEPILAVFHASSAGLTRTSSDVWSGDDKPYLQPVTSPENADNTPNYYSRVTFTINEYRDKLQSAFPKANISGDPYDWLSGEEHDSAGNIITAYVGGIKTQGSRLRSALGLRSACFTWEMADGKVSFYVTGYGHGVGLSQYGANQMARDGANYREILTHYYTGVSIGGYTP